MCWTATRLIKVKSQHHLRPTMFSDFKTNLILYMAWVFGGISKVNVIINYLHNYYN